MINSKKKGEIAEAFVAAKFLEKGWTVLKPLGDNDRYDFVVDRGRGFERVQVKSNWNNSIDDKVTFSLRSIRVNKNKNVSKTYHDEIDLMAFYCASRKEVYLLEFNMLKHLKSNITIRIMHTANHPNKDLSFYSKDYVM
jgi:hypothetical protein